MQAIKKKKECDAKALAIVLKLIDPMDDPEELLVLVSSAFSSKPKFFIKLFSL
jgi:hypothetical protein